MTEFEKAVIAEVKRVRDLLNQAELANSFEFNMKANGRLSDGDVKIMFEIELDYDRIVAANSVDGAVYEALRRRGWIKANGPLCLPIVEETKPATDITGDII